MYPEYDFQDKKQYWWKQSSSVARAALPDTAVCSLQQTFSVARAARPVTAVFFITVNFLRCLRRAAGSRCLFSNSNLHARLLASRWYSSVVEAMHAQPSPSRLLEDGSAVSRMYRRVWNTHSLGRIYYTQTPFILEDQTCTYNYLYLYYYGKNQIIFSTSWVFYIYVWKQQ